MSFIQPLVQNTKLTDDQGYLTVEFKRYMDDLLARIGGIQGGSYNQLAINTGVIAWDLNNAPVSVVVMNQNATLASPVSMVAGPLGLYRITFVQDATGGRTLSWGGAFKFAGGTPVVLSTAANAVDEFVFDSDGTNMKLIAGAKDIR